MSGYVVKEYTYNLYVDNAGVHNEIVNVNEYKFSHLSSAEDFAKTQSKELGFKIIDNDNIGLLEYTVYDVLNDGSVISNCVTISSFTWRTFFKCADRYRDYLNERNNWYVTVDAALVGAW